MGDFCGHIKFRMKLCKVRDKAKCPIAGCPDVHAINNVLKIQFCNDYLEDPSQCKKISCLPHFNLDELQERYHLAIRARVLNCSKCIFRCKHFNLPTSSRRNKDLVPMILLDDVCTRMTDWLFA